MIEQGVVAIDVNLGDIVLIDSSALAELVRTQRSLHAVGGALRILRPSDSVRVILEVTGLNAIFEISES